jgi:uncharacterized protein YerC
MKKLSKYTRYRIGQMLKEALTIEQIATLTGFSIHQIKKVK